jgi:hypothetical protein
MVKIPELKDKQLIAQIYKYDKILKSLLKERKRRIAKGAKPESLMTPTERQVAKKMKAKGKIEAEIEENTSPIAQEDDNLEQAGGLELSSEETTPENTAGEAEEEEDEEEEVRVTQLLQLSQDQIADFKEKSLAAAKNKKKAKKKKKGLFGL